MNQPDASRRSLPPTTSLPLRARRFVLAATAVALLTAAGCGRSADNDVLGSSEGDPDIAGVVVTSPDAVVTPAPGEAVASTTTGPSTTLPQQVLYTVEPGDTLSVIAGEFGVPTDELAAFNGITDVNSIKPGDQLAIPPVVAAPEAAPDASADPAADTGAEGGDG